MEDVNEAAAPAAPPPKRRSIANSHWCMHKEHGLGMLGEISPIPKFHKYVAPTKDTPAGVEADAIAVDVADLALCTPTQLPPHLGYTDEQLKDLGYAD